MSLNEIWQRNRQRCMVSQSEKLMRLQQWAVLPYLVHDLDI